MGVARDRRRSASGVGPPRMWAALVVLVVSKEVYTIPTGESAGESMGRGEVEVGMGVLQSHDPHPQAHCQDTLRVTLLTPAPLTPAEAEDTVA